MDRAYTNQEFFNKVWERAKIQERASQVMQGCQYRVGKDPNGLPCFVGAAIPNEDYKGSFEGMELDEVLKTVFTLKELPIRLVRTVQEIHDSYSRKDWEDQLRKVAKDYKLEIPQ